MYTLLKCSALVAGLSLGLVGCSRSGAPSAETPAPVASSGRLNIDELFPKGEGRDLVLNDCQTCHNFAPILTLQMDAQQWDRNSVDHRERVSQLTDAEFQSLYRYLKQNFNPSTPVPKLPKEMLDAWTSY